MIEEALFYQYYGEQVGNSIDFASSYSVLLLFVLALGVVFYAFRSI